MIEKKLEYGGNGSGGGSGRRDNRRDDWFRLKKWFLFCYCVLSLKAIIVLQIISLTQVKQSELLWLSLNDPKSGLHLVTTPGSIRPKDVWPVLTMTALFILIYNLTLLATYHHHFWLSIFCANSIAIITCLAIPVAILVTPFYWVCVLLNTIESFFAFVFILDLRDIRNHVFVAKHVTEHYVNNVNNYVQKMDTTAVANVGYSLAMKTRAADKQHGF